MVKTKKKSRVAKQSGTGLHQLIKNKWFVLGLIMSILIAGVIVLRVSKASTQILRNCARVIYTGREPDDGTEPHIDYEVCVNGKVGLRKSTNGQTKIANSIDQAYSLGEQMYNEMLAEPKTQAPAPSSANPTTSPSATPAASNTNQQPTQINSSNKTNTANNNAPTQDNSSAISSSQSVNQQKQKPVIAFTLRRTIDLVPKLPVDSSQVAKVKYTVDNRDVATINQSPFNFEFDTTQFSNGKHTLTTTVYDKNNKPLFSTSYPITIDNPNTFWAKVFDTLGL